MLHGEYVKYFSDGVISDIINYNNGMKHGYYREFWLDGEELDSYFYAFDKRVNLEDYGLDPNTLTDDDMNLLRVLTF